MDKFSPWLRVGAKAAINYLFIITAMGAVSIVWSFAQMAVDYAQSDPYVFPLGYIACYLCSLIKEALTQRTRMEMEALRSQPEARKRPLIFKRLDDRKKESGGEA